MQSICSPLVRLERFSYQLLFDIVQIQSLIIIYIQEECIVPTLGMPDVIRVMLLRDPPEDAAVLVSAEPRKRVLTQQDHFRNPVLTSHIHGTKDCSSKDKL